MTISIFPVDAVSSSPNYTGRQLRQTIGALVGGKNSSRRLGGNSGIAPGTGVAVTLSASTYTVVPHAGVIDVESTAIAGPYLYSVDANVTGSVPSAPSAGLVRYDLISLTLADPAEDASLTPSLTVTYTTGTPASLLFATTPATPALSMALAVVTNDSTGPTAIATVAKVAIAAGGIAVDPVSLQNYTGQFSYIASSGFFVYDGTRAIKVTQGGTSSYTILSGTSAITGTVTFGTRYTNTPTVTASVISAGSFNHGATVTAVSATGFSYRAFRTPGDNAGSNQAGVLSWIAVP